MDIFFVVALEAHIIAIRFSEILLCEANIRFVPTESSDWDSKHL